MSIQAEETGITPRTWAIAVWSLYLAGFLFPVWHLLALTPVVGVVVAYVKRGGLAGSPFASHMTSAIYTFWVFCFGSVVAYANLISPASSILVDFLLVGVVAWTVFRELRGLGRAIEGKPIENPTGWL